MRDSTSYIKEIFDGKGYSRQGKALRERFLNRRRIGLERCTYYRIACLLKTVLQRLR